MNSTKNLGLNLPEEDDFFAGFLVGFAAGSSSPVPFPSPAPPIVSFTSDIL